MRIVNRINLLNKHFMLDYVIACCGPVEHKIITDTAAQWNKPMLYHTSGVKLSWQLLLQWETFMITDIKPLSFDIIIHRYGSQHYRSLVSSLQ